MTEIGIIVGSTRPGRRSDSVARWVQTNAARRNDAKFELVDIADFGLPLLDEPVPAAIGKPQHAHTKAWAKTVGGFDGFVFVTPEYNHSVPAALKNAIDYVFSEWHDKACGFVSYGLEGGIRAVDQLRVALAEVKIADVRTQVALTLRDDFELTSMTDPGSCTPRQRPAELLERMLDEVIAWTDALAPLRPQTRS